MAKRGSSEVAITYDDSPGGTGRVITGFVLEMGALKITAEQQPSHAFGDNWRESIMNGMRMVDAIRLRGFFDDTATTGPHTVLKVGDNDAAVAQEANTRTLVLAFGGSGNTFTIETRLAEYSVLGKNGQLTEFEALIQPTGSGAWS